MRAYSIVNIIEYISMKTNINVTICMYYCEY